MGGGAASWFDALGTLSSPEADSEDGCTLGVDAVTSAVAKGPLDNFENVKIGSVLRVLSDSADVVRTGIEAGLSEETWESAWASSAGKAVRVLQLDTDNGQVKCQVPGIQEVWFPVAALMEA